MKIFSLLRRRHFFLMIPLLDLQEAYKNVYNWQFVHCVDFWCTVLGRACDTTAEAAKGKSSELRPLIYPLVQVSLGAIK